MATQTASSYLTKAETEAAYLRLAGVSGGQTVHGGTAESDKLIVYGNSHAGSEPFEFGRETLTCKNVKVNNVLEAAKIHGTAGGAIGEMVVKLLEVTEDLIAPNLLADGGLALSPANVAEVTETKNNWELPSKHVWYRLKANASHEVTGIYFPGGPEPGQIIILTNMGTVAGRNLVFKNQNAGSEAEYRFKNSTEADITLEINHTVAYMFDLNVERWRDVFLR